MRRVCGCYGAYHGAVEKAVVRVEFNRSGVDGGEADVRTVFVDIRTVDVTGLQLSRHARTPGRAVKLDGCAVARVLLDHCFVLGRVRVRVRV